MKRAILFSLFFLGACSFDLNEAQEAYNQKARSQFRQFQTLFSSEHKAEYQELDAEENLTKSARKFVKAKRTPLDNKNLCHLVMGQGVNYIGWIGNENQFLDAQQRTAGIVDLFGNVFYEDHFGRKKPAGHVSSVMFPCPAGHHDEFETMPFGP